MLGLAGFIDTHSHMPLWGPPAGPAPEFHARRPDGVQQLLLARGAPGDWAPTRAFAHAWGLGYLLGIHPLFVKYADEAALARLRAEVEASLEDPFFIGIGEIGLDGFVPGQDQAHAEAVFAECLAIARDYALPASIHVRKSASRVLMHLRRRMPAGGAVHAFNGSDQERESFLQLGLKLGFGGAATYAGSLRIRRHLAEVPEDAWVLETDAPDMPTSRRRDAFAHGALLLDTAPADILEAADAAAMLRALPLEAVAAVSRRNAIAAFPRLAPLLTRPDAFARRGRDTLD